MPVKQLIKKIEHSHPKHLQSLVENRRIYNTQNCELNVFETFRESYQVPLSFDDFVISSMVSGKKVMHMLNEPVFNFLPGESLIIPPGEKMLVDYPEANDENPTQCVVLAINAQYVNDTVNYLNNYYNSDPDHSKDWKLQFNKYHFENETDIAELINKLVRLCSSGEKTKSIYADLNIKELLIRLIQSQHLTQVAGNLQSASNQSRLHFVLHYIHEHITEKINIDMLCRKAYMSRNNFFKWFKEQFGITPLEYINRERIKLSKQLLNDDKNTVSHAGLQAGFTDVNYFVRLFKKSEGITPGAYQQCLIKE